ncbi:hypothetical protein [Spongiivirga citrea]|uniref:Uncharacterized protein n=1 Tax=Spongiivirga citrea TaxID=1481457 RepID=A0A6M0CGB8_9FLAO|nr:hypothetical protein [Spongiivirga citrea]NER16482.1 hypothetical protein [Spongiivirga citrea]
MNRKNLHLVTGILTGIVFISALLDSDAGTLFGSIWLFRGAFLLISVASLLSYFKIKKSEKDVQ